MCIGRPSAFRVNDVIERNVRVLILIVHVGT